MKTRILLLTSTLMFVTLACSFDIPLSTYETGDSQTLTFSEPSPEEEQVTDVIIEMSAGKLEISGGSDGLLDGNIEYNVPELEPAISSSNDYYAITQDIEFDTAHIPVGKYTNRWDIMLGNNPINLIVNAGAYDGDMDLSTLPLVSLDISDGASNADIIFNLPNPVSMEYLNYRTGASNIQISGLSNANFREMNFEGGAGSYTFDFSGELQEDCQVYISSGVSTIKIIVPEDTRSVVNLVGGVNNIYLTGTWTINDRIYETEGEGPILNIQVNMTVGSLDLISEQ